MLNIPREFERHRGYLPESWNIALSRKQAAEETIRKQALSIMRKNGVPEWMRDLVLCAAQDHGVSPVDIVGKTRKRTVVAARNQVWYTIRERNPSRYTWPMIGRWFGRDHTTVIYGVSKHAEEAGLRRLTTSEFREKREALRERNRRRKEARVSIQHVREQP